MWGGRVVEAERPLAASEFDLLAALARSQERAPGARLSAALGLAAVAAQGRHPWPSGSRVPWGVAGASAGLEDGAQAGDGGGERVGGGGGGPEGEGLGGGDGGRAEGAPPLERQPPPRGGRGDVGPPPPR